MISSETLEHCGGMHRLTLGCSGADLGFLCAVWGGVRLLRHWVVRGAGASGHSAARMSRRLGHGVWPHSHGRRRRGGCPVPACIDAVPRLRRLHRVAPSATAAGEGAAGGRLREGVREVRGALEEGAEGGAGGVGAVGGELGGVGGGELERHYLVQVLL